MEIQEIDSSKGILILNSVLNSLRRQLKKFSQLGLFVRILRTLIHFGPWRVVPQFLIRQFRPVVKTNNESSKSLLGTLDTKTIAEELKENSFAIGGILPSEFLSRLRSVADKLPVHHYNLIHEIDVNVRQLSVDPMINEVLRAYFNCEPVLLESTLVVTDLNDIHGLSDQNSFHFDYAGWQSLNVFVYLTDVTHSSAHHIVARGSHKSIGFKDIIRGSITNGEAKSRFGDSIQDVLGVAGTLFFENTEAFHRRHPGEGRRVILNLLYASHRSWLSHGRSSGSHIEKRAEAYSRFAQPYRNE